MGSFSGQLNAHAWRWSGEPMYMSALYEAAPAMKTLLAIWQRDIMRTNVSQIRQVGSNCENSRSVKRTWRFLDPAEYVFKLFHISRIILLTQAAQKRSLIRELFAGIRMDVFPDESFPSGKFFKRLPKENNPSFDKIFVLQYYWIRGHDNKIARFKHYHMWNINV